MITVQTANQADIQLLNYLGEQSFYPTYLPFIAKDQVDYMFHKMYDEDSLREQMNVRAHVFIIGLENNTPLGFAAYQLDAKEKGVAKLHKLYVLPDRQVNGIGKLLLQTVELNARNAGQKSLLLNVNRYNIAIGFYKHLGYNIISEDDIDIGNGFFMNDFEMEKAL